MVKWPQWDTELLLWINGLGSEITDPVWIFFSDKYVWIPLYAFLVYLLFKHLPLRAFILALAAVVLCVILADQGSVHLFKNAFQRLRPCHTPDLLELLRVPKGCGGSYGFVSSHAANAFVLAVFVGRVLRPHQLLMPGILMAWAILVALSRLFLGVHYPLDILFGGLFGALVALFVYRIYAKAVFSVESTAR
jgi:undecaprenyl-diphosphatase